MAIHCRHASVPEVLLQSRATFIAQPMDNTVYYCPCSAPPSQFLWKRAIHAVFRAGRKIYWHKNYIIMQKTVYNALECGDYPYTHTPFLRVPWSEVGGAGSLGNWTCRTETGTETRHRLHFVSGVGGAGGREGASSPPPPPPPPPARPAELGTNNVIEQMRGGTQYNIHAQQLVEIKGWNSTIFCN